MFDLPVTPGGRRYVVSVGCGIGLQIPDRLAALSGRRIVLVSSARVWSLHGRPVERALRRVGPVSRVLLPDGERFKSAFTVHRLHGAFLDAGLGRDGVVVAFGGGVVGDLAGFAAATYMRGVDWVQIPTTLLAMVDSSIGGKVGVNYARVKNLVGAFHQPLAVISDLAFLDTLPLRQLRSGAYETLKCGVVGDRALVRAMRGAPEGLRSWAPEDLESAVASACRVKIAIVEKDEREAGLRRLLNLGHTVGHALEAATRYRRFTHGEAVGWGLLAAGTIALRRSLLTTSSFEKIAAAVDRIGPRPPVSDLDHQVLLEAIAHDKKARDGRVHFVLPTAVGRCTIRGDVTVREIRRALAAVAAAAAPRS